MLDWLIPVLAKDMRLPKDGLPDGIHAKSKCLSITFYELCKANILNIVSVGPLDKWSHSRGTHACHGHLTNSVSLSPTPFSRIWALNSVHLEH